MMKRWLAVLVLFFYASVSLAEALPGRVIQIQTHLQGFLGNPAWLLIIRDLDQGVVHPYLYDFTTSDHYWIALSYAHRYQITVSALQFNPYPAKTTNFCHLEGRILDGESMFITLKGELTPDKRGVKCYVKSYRS